jgi:hypothetical protein
MKDPERPRKWRRLYILDEQNRPVEVANPDEWSRWMAENDLVFRRTLLEESGGMVTTRFRGMSDAADGLVFITRVTGLSGHDNESFGAASLDVAMEEHERIVQKLLHELAGR